MKKKLSKMRRKNNKIYSSASKSAIREEQEFLESEEKILKQNISLLNETLHEVRKINNQLKSSVLQLSNALRSVYIDSNKSIEIENIRKNIEANTSLLSIRMDTYDMILNPDSIKDDMVVPIPIYKKIEKVYKCLYAQRKEKDIDVKMDGHTGRAFRLNNTIELAFFIIVDNAIKYSPVNEEVKIEFLDCVLLLEVTFTNWGIRPNVGEMAHIRERGFRSQKVINETNIEGSGLGLYLLQQICDSNNVKLDIHIGNGSQMIKGLSYAPFVVKLTFLE